MVDMFDVFDPMMLKDQATIEEALRKALKFKPMLTEEEKAGVIYKPDDQLKQYCVVIRLLFAGGNVHGLYGDASKPLLHMACSGNLLQDELCALLDGGANSDI